MSVAGQVNIINSGKIQHAPNDYIAVPLDLFENLVWEVENLLTAKTLQEQADTVVALSNHLSDIKSYHRDYDVNRNSFYPLDEE